MSEAECSLGDLNNLPPHSDRDRFASIVIYLYLQEAGPLHFDPLFT